ncbi:MAG: SGNH/GDSL hydrolase family protein [Phycisphaerales bacterium]|jgi:lysophospholipase L1-like esterase|nr:SGNH/GDSL hydrolase family protein [Phycisphaerales bacterium]
MNTELQKIETLLGRQDPIKWVFTGDSITHGALHTMGWRDYTELFSERIRYEMARTRDAILKTAISGWRIDQILEDLHWNVLQYQPNVVSIAVGMNDCNNGPAGLELFQKQYLEVIDTIRNKTSAAIVVHTPPQILKLDEARWPLLPSYVDAIRKIAQKSGALLIDDYELWLAAEKRGVLPYWLSDSIHPNECGHRAMAHLMMKKLNLWKDDSFVCRLFVP